MGSSLGPSVVRDGLILDLDIANRKSYIDPHKNSFINYSSWADGQVGSVSDFGTVEDAAGESVRVISTDPWGNQSVMWETRASGNGNADGGWQGSWYNVDRTKLYRFSVWMRRTSSSTGGNYYFGLHGTGGTWGVDRLDGGGIQGNPYWECTNIGQYTQNQWYLFVGHCYPVGTSGIIIHPDSGYYSTDGTKYSWGGCNVGGDVKMLADTTSLLLRTFHFYCPDSTSRLQLAHPRLEVCDGKQPTIAELLNNSPSMIKDMSGYGNHHELSNCDIPRDINPSRFVLDGSRFGLVRNAALSGVTDNCTVVVYYKTTDSVELWVRGNNDGGRYLSASSGNNYYHGNAGSSITNFVDLNQVANPTTPVNYRDGQYHMWEAKGVDFTGWSRFDWFLYHGDWQLLGDVSRVMVYNRSITADESRRNFQALRGRFGI